MWIEARIIVKIPFGFGIVEEKVCRERERENLTSFGGAQIFKNDSNYMSV